MPFKSQKQRALFYAKMNRGELSPETVKKWEEHTPKHKKLPTYVEKKAMASGFWEGFSKRAAAAIGSYIGTGTADTPGAPEKMLKWNGHGGVDPRSPEEAQAAQSSGMITLPPDVDGARCGTCMHFRPIAIELGHGFCTNPAIKQDVTEHMHCANWGHPGSHDAAAESEFEDQQQQAIAAQQGPGATTAGGQVPGQPQTPDMASFMVQQGLGGGQPQAPVAPGGTQQSDQVPEDAEGLPDGETAKPSMIGTQSGFPAGPQTSGNPLVEQAVDDFQGQAATAASTGGPGGASPERKAKKSPSKKANGGSGKKPEGSVINIHVGKDAEKKAGISGFWRGIVDDQ